MDRASERERERKNHRRTREERSLKILLFFDHRLIFSLAYRSYQKTANHQQDTSDVTIYGILGGLTELIAEKVC